MKLFGSRGFPLTQNKKGDLVIAHTLAEAVERGRVYAIANQTGVTGQAGLSATTPVLTVANQVGSGVRLKLWGAWAADLVAFAAAAEIWLCLGGGPEGAVVTGTPTTAHRNLKNGMGNPKVDLFLAATLPAAPVGIDALGVGLTGAISTVPALQSIGRWYPGAPFLYPGFNWTIQYGTASGTNSSIHTFIFEEEDLPEAA